MKKLLTFIKKEIVLCAALLLAVLSAFVIPPDREYAGYIDYRTLAILFSLMSVMAGLQKLGLLHRIAQGLLGRVKSRRGLILILVLLCFFSSMLITNDVALITFVPFTFTVLGMMGEEQRCKLVLPLIAMQTIAANLGSMLTPIGNPQNLYLYGKAEVSIGEFVWLMLPYTLLSLLLLTGWALILGGGGRGRLEPRQISGMSLESGESGESGKTAILRLVAYLTLFGLCLLAVAHVLPWQAALAAVLVTVSVTDRKVLRKVDYSLLLTFVGFFIFIGNMGRIPVFRDFLQNVVTGRETYAAVAASQIISNVPAALLLSGFTDNYRGLIIGTNLGGLGTLIASMASLISYKYVAKEEGGRKGAYIGIFTVSNLVFLVVLLIFDGIMSKMLRI